MCLTFCYSELGGGGWWLYPASLPLLRCSFKDKRFVERLDRSGEPGYWSELLNQDGLTFYSRRVFFLFWSLMTVTYSWPFSRTALMTLRRVADFHFKGHTKMLSFSFYFFSPRLWNLIYGTGGGHVTVWERKEVWSCQLCYRPISWKYESQSKRRGFGDMTA